MKKNTGKYEFKTVYSGMNVCASLLCPQCGESLTRSDIEMYPYCPFCNCKLEQNGQFDEFILHQALTDWYRESLQNLPMLNRSK